MRNAVRASLAICAMLMLASGANAFYDAVLGRFATRDPIGENGGINLYEYVGNNPVNAIDPLGLVHAPDRFLEGGGDGGEMIEGGGEQLTFSEIWNVLVGEPAEAPTPATAPASEAPSSCPANRGIAPGSFSISDWSGYPDSVPQPEGPFRLLQGLEYDSARATANNINNAMHAADESLGGWQLHEIQPVKFGGCPTDITNKFPLPADAHAEFTNWWNAMQRYLETGQYMQPDL